MLPWHEVTNKEPSYEEMFNVRFELNKKMNEGMGNDISHDLGYPIRGCYVMKGTNVIHSYIPEPEAWLN